MSEILELESFAIRDWSFENGRAEQEEYWFRVMAQMDATICDVNSKHTIADSQLNNEYAHVTASSVFSLSKKVKREFSTSPLPSYLVDMLSELLQIHLAHTRSVFYDISGSEIARRNGTGSGIYIPITTISKLKTSLLTKLSIDVVPGFPTGHNSVFEILSM